MMSVGVWWHDSHSPPGSSSRGTVFGSGSGREWGAEKTQGGFDLGQNNDQFRRAESYRPDTAKFARLSTSMQLTLLLIRRAQISSGMAVARLAGMGSQRGDTKE